MGLGVSIGALADFIIHDEEGAEWQRRSLAQVNAVLARHKLPTHDEPERFAKRPHQGACTSFPYSFLHYLRRAFAHVREEHPVPDDEELRPEHESVIEDAATMFDSHLLCHSDCEGFYVPVDFDEPIFDDEVPTGMLGSSQGLLRELIEVAPHIGIELVDDRPTPAVVKELRKIEDSGPFWRERVVWDTLFEAATLSIQHHTAIVFH